MSEKRSALITGCSTGIGRATAVELTKRGYEVVATARRPETLDDLDVAQRLALDVDDDKSVARVREAVGAIDVLVNNAGFGLEGPVESAPLAEVRRLFETNFFGAVRRIQAFVPAMRERGRGAVVNVSSVNGVVGPPLAGYYSASKFALEGLSESLHLEVGHFGVRVVVIEPGVIETRFSDNAIDHRPEPGPYAELATMWEGALDTLSGGTDAPGPELVAATIGEALEAEPYRLRWPVGADADLVTGTRGSMSYDEFEASMREVLQVDW